MSQIAAFCVIWIETTRKKTRNNKNTGMPDTGKDGTVKKKDGLKHIQQNDNPHTHPALEKGGTAAWQ